MKISVSRDVYDDTSISKCVYAFSDKFSFRRVLNENIEEITVLPHDGNTIPTNFEMIFFDALNDYKLRGIIEEQTKDIRTLLYAKAFMNNEELDEE